MALPLRYNLRSALVRWRSTTATILGIGCVVAVYMLVQSMAAGLERSSHNTGDPRNILITRKGSTAESSSQVTREQVKVIQYLPGVARDEKGEPLLSADVLVLINAERIGGGEANVNVRGMSQKGIPLRPQVQLAQGRWFEPGKREVVVAERLAARFANFNIGDTFKTAGHELTVVGWMNGNNSAFDSEVWMDVDQARAVFDRDYYSSVIVRASEPGNTNILTGRLEGDKRLPLRAERETDYYGSQTMTATPIRFLGNFLASAMSIGAVFAAMNTMYASVGARTREIGTLRVLGYRRRAVLVGFLLEGGFLAVLGGVVGCLLSLPMNGYATGTLSFNTFSEVVFQFRITPQLALKGIAFAIVVGFIGSFLPAVRASRLPVIASLKAL